jgi:formamidopyrimidine-DNA glycosylase
MPELPEVETVLRAIQKSGIVGSPISRVEINKNRHIKEITPEEFTNKLLGETIHSIERKGKQLVFILDEWALLSHLRMNGKYFFDKVPPELLIEGRAIGVMFHFVNGRKLIFCDTRGFGAFYLQSLDNYKSLSPYKDIGPDLVDDEIDIDKLFAYCQKIRLPIKMLLLDQKFVAGIGNIYASEILFAAKIHPLTITKNLAKEQIKKIIKFSQSILKKAIELKGTSIVDFLTPSGEKGSYQNELKVYFRDKKPCYNCQTAITRVSTNGRGTFFCTSCQKLESQ